MRGSSFVEMSLSVAIEIESKTRKSRKRSQYCRASTGENESQVATSDITPERERRQASQKKR